MNQKSKLNRIYLPLLFAVIIISVAFRCAAVLTDFDSRTGYFEGKTLINIASITAICGSVLLFTYAFVSAKKEKLIATFTTPSTYVPSGAIVTALIFFAVKTYERIKDYDFSSGASPNFGSPISRLAGNLPAFVEAALVPLALLSAVYFILNATVENRASVTRAAFGLSMVVFSALYATFLYFDKTLSINAPNKIVDQMAFVFTALFFLYEIRISLGRECWHLYISFGFIAAVLSAYSSIPSIILYLCDKETVSHSIQENVLLLCIFIFVLSRVLLAGRLNPDKESEFVIAMRENARARHEYITAKEEVEREAYLELYNRFKEIEELSLDVNENELFGIQSDSEEVVAKDSEVSVGDSEESEKAEIAKAENERVKDASDDIKNPKKVVEIKDNFEETPIKTEEVASNTAASEYDTTLQAQANADEKKTDTVTDKETESAVTEGSAEEAQAAATESSAEEAEDAATEGSAEGTEVTEPIHNTTNAGEDDSEPNSEKDPESDGNGDSKEE